MKLIALAASAACAAANNHWNSWNHQKWSKPQKYEIVYGYDTSYVELCTPDNYHTGKYQCVRGKDDDYSGLCRFSYVRDCDKDYKNAKEVRKYWKKVYYDTEFETDCDKPHLFYSDYSTNQWHRGLAATKAAEDKTTAAKAAGGVRSLGGDGWKNQRWQHDGQNWQGCPQPPQPYVEYGYDEVYVKECDDNDAYEGKYTCYKTADDGYEGLCRFGYTKECDKGDHGAKLVRRYWKKVYYDEEFVKDCEQNYQAWYPTHSWQQWGNQWSSWNSWQHNNDWNNNNWQHKNEWNKDSWQNKNEWNKDSWGANGGRRLNNNGGNEWHNGWAPQRWSSWGQQQWQPNHWHQQQWQQQWYSNECNSWQPGCHVPNQPRYEYGYDLVTVTYCDEKDYHTGEYACVKGEDDKHEDICRFAYVKPCEKDHPSAKTVKVFWKKIYFDREFEGECKQTPHYWQGWNNNEHQKWNNQWQGEQKWSGNHEQKWNHQEQKWHNSWDRK